MHTCCPLCAACCVLPVVCCPLCAAYCVLPVVCCPLCFRQLNSNPVAFDTAESAKDLCQSISSVYVRHFFEESVRFSPAACCRCTCARKGSGLPSPACAWASLNGACAQHYHLLQVHAR